jgi:hypothetical protein
MNIISIAGLLRLIVLLFLLEGAVKKWVGDIPGNGLVAAREAIMLCMIPYLWHMPVRRLLRLFEPVFFILMVGNFVFIVIHFLFLHRDISVSFIAMKYWILAPVLSFELVRRASFDDFRPALRVLWNSAPFMALLVVFQNLMPPSDWINHLPDAVDGNVMTVAGDIVRVSGTFSHPFGFSVYLSLLTPVLLSPFGSFKGGVIALRSEAEFKAAIQGLLLLLIMVGVSGSRSAWTMGGAMVVVWFALHAVNLRRAAPMPIGRLLVVTVCLLGVSGLFLGGDNRNIEAMSQRVDAASESEDIVVRVGEILFGERHAWDGFTLLGYGMGLGSNIYNVRSGSGDSFSLAETESGRILLEAGLWGGGVIAFRVLLGLALLARVLRNFIYIGSGFSVMVTIQAAIALFTWPASGQLSASFGLCFLLAASVLHQCEEEEWPSGLAVYTVNDTTRQ